MLWRKKGWKLCLTQLRENLGKNLNGEDIYPIFFNCEIHLNYLDEKRNKGTLWEGQEFDPKVTDNDCNFCVFPLTYTHMENKNTYVNLKCIIRNVQPDEILQSDHTHVTRTPINKQNMTNTPEASLGSLPVPTCLQG